MEEMRRRLNTEEVEEPPADENSQSDSQTSSVEGVYGAISGRTTHPFKVVDHDALSLQSGVSVGRVGRLPGTSSSSHSSTQGTTTSSQLTQSTVFDNSSSQGLPEGSQKTLAIQKTTAVTSDDVPCSSSSILPTTSRSTGAFIPEPDVVISCKDKTIDFREIKVPPPPVAPPRRKRKVLAPSVSRPDEGGHSVVDGNPRRSLADAQEIQPSKKEGGLNSPPSPTVSIRSMCRDMDKQLESPNQKYWVVKAQDEEKTRAKSSGPKVLRRTESLPKDVIAAFDPSGSGSGGQRENSQPNSQSSTLNSANGTTVESSNLSNVITSPSSAIAITNSSNSESNPILSPNPPPMPKATGNLQLSSLISALAAMEERKDSERQLNMNLRTRTDSGKFLSDLEILEQVQVCVSNKHKSKTWYYLPLSYFT